MSKAENLSSNPELPPELKEAALDGNLVLFIGAGASMLLGMPSWSGLARKVLEDLRSIDAINYAELDQLTGLNPREQLSRAALIAKKEAHSLNLRQYLVKKKESTIYDLIRSIGAVCVTTNYDHELSPVSLEIPDNRHTAPKAKRVSGIENLSISDLKIPGTVIHLHGDMENSAGMIVTTRDYLAHYDSKEVQHFLKDLFARQVVLFIGYGLEEEEILEYMQRRADVERDKQERNRFSLQAFFRSEQPLFEKRKKYYKTSFGVHLVGFSRDDEDYTQLEKILKNWAEQIEVRAPASIDALAAIDKVTADG